MLVVASEECPKAFLTTSRLAPFLTEWVATVCRGTTPIHAAYRHGVTFAAPVR